MLKRIDYVEHLNMLHYLSGLLKVESYLEVGVREGASLLCVLCEEPQVADFALNTIADGRTRLTNTVIKRVSKAFTLRKHIRDLYLLDLWGYRADPHGTHIRNLIHTGFPTRFLNAKVMQGDSKKKIPELFKENPDLMLDLVLVDGDHSDAGVKADLDNLAGHFKVLVAHDVFNPEYPTMINIIKQYARDHNLLTAYCGKYTGTGTVVMFNMSVKK